MSDWNPESYARFRDLRLRPALDLLAQAGALPGGDVVDLGCGDGAAAAALRAAFPGRRLVGVDASPAMLAKAAGYDARAEADIAHWQPDAAPALIFSNAALQWLGDHARLMPRLARFLPPGGVLAVQMPRQFDAPSHRLLRDLAAQMFPDRFDFSDWQPPVAAPARYWEILADLGELNVWESEYLQPLPACAAAHPVRRFTESTMMRPFLAKLAAEEAPRFSAAYDAGLATAYPPDAAGGVLMPFRRLFFVLRVTG